MLRPRKPSAVEVEATGSSQALHWAPFFLGGGGEYFSNLVVFHDMSNNECAYNVAEGSQEDHRKGAQCSWRNPALLKTNTFLTVHVLPKGGQL